MKSELHTGRFWPYYTFYIRLIILLGIFLRLYHYLMNRSLYGDEAYVAVNFFDRGFKELLLPLEYGQRAPIGFLWGVKFFSLFGGHSEFSLRFFSLVAGISSLFLFHHWLKKNFSARVTLVGLLLLAIAEPLIYFSSELKQYMLELSVTLIAFLYCVPHPEDKSGKLSVKGALGAMLIWFSFPAIFVLAGIACAQIVYYRKRSLVVTHLCVYTFWALSFTVNYFLFVRSGTKDEFLQGFWQPHFLPLSLGIFRWVARLIYLTLNIPLGLNYSIVAVFAFFTGVYQLWKKNIKISLLLVCPTLLALIASALHKYPFHGRFLIFIAPAFIVWIAAGIMFCYNYISQFRKYSYLKYLVMVALLAPPFILAFYRIIYPKTFFSATRQEIRPLIEEMLQNRKAGEVLFVHQLAGAQFKYYDKLLGVTEQLKKEDLLINTSGNINDSMHPVQIFNSQNLKLHTDLYLSKRAWVLFCRDKYEVEKLSLEFLNRNFQLLGKSKDIRASLYLYQRR